MVALKPALVDRFIARPDPAVRAVLVYGPDTGLVAERARAVARSVVDDLEDPFNVSRLDDGALAADPGLLADEAAARSLMGGRRLVWVRGAGSAFAAAAERYLADTAGTDAGDTLIVAEAGDLRPSTRLRKLFETSKQAVAMPCYADTGKSIGALIGEELSRRGLAITPGAHHRLTALLGADRQLSRNEIDKLCLYVHGRDTIGEDDVEAICGDASASTLDELADATAGGELDRLDTAYARALAAGLGTTSVVLALARHFARLQLLRHAAGPSGNYKQAVSTARPKIHYTRAEAVGRQLAIWSDADLRRALASLAEVEAGSRLNAELAETLVGRTLMTIARRAQAIRLRRA